MDTATRSDLSQEIVEQIVHYLHDDIKTLKTLATISFAVWSICRPLLFHSLRLNSGSHTKWAGILRNTPDLCSFIQEVVILAGGGDYFLDRDEGLVVSILDSISRPKAIRLGKTGPSGTRPWTRLPAWLQVAISKIISRPTVREVKLAGLTQIPLSFFFGLSHIRELQLINCTFTAPPASSSPCLKDPKVPLSTFYVKSSGTFAVHYYEFDRFLGHPQFPLDLTHLSQLHVHVKPWNYAETRRLLSICGQHLLYLSISLEGGLLRIPRLTSLCVLHFHLPMPAFAMTGETINEIGTTLVHTPGSLSNDKNGSLQEIIISVNIKPDIFQMFPRYLWTNLDFLLVHLSPVRVQVVTWGDQVSDWKLLLPALHETGRLSLSSRLDLDCASFLRL
ncbi:hypothetical protein BDN72DRAFT_849847 [Pluteus cervinus]|uniref:Uncharacterized protein n=1 Tax=Pluteus cervinus TaxID=181527 RepID=A0ACD3A6I7_9AGAR|nr:hypothetical protein BDN72DRAFT_849847 [Pluteus cervinus]